MRKSIRRTTMLLGATGAALAMTIAPASAAAPHDGGNAESKVEKAGAHQATHALSPETQEAWETFISGGNALTGGAAMLVSGAWVGAPLSVMQIATTGEIGPDVYAAWETWNTGGKLVGRGAAQLVSGAWIGAPSSIMDLIANGAGPGDLSQDQLDQVSFLIPKK